MAATPWAFYNSAKRYLMDGSIDLDTDTFRMSLFTSASNAGSASNLSVIGSVTNEVAEQFGYSSSGKALTGVSWSTGASAGEMRFDSTALAWAAVGGDIEDVKYAVIWKQGASAGANKVVCFSQLSTSQFTVTSGNSLTVTPSAYGIFELN